MTIKNIPPLKCIISETIPSDCLSIYKNRCRLKMIRFQYFVYMANNFSVDTRDTVLYYHKQCVWLPIAIFHTGIDAIHNITKWQQCTFSRSTMASKILFRGKWNCHVNRLWICVIKDKSLYCHKSHETTSISF